MARARLGGGPTCDGGAKGSGGAELHGNTHGHCVN